MKALPACCLRSASHVGIVALFVGSLVAGPALAASKPAVPSATVEAAAIYCAAPTEALSLGLSRAIAAQRMTVLGRGALASAGQTVVNAQRALGELRCGEAVPALEQAEAGLLQDVPVEDGRVLLGQVESLILLCADRLNDGARAHRAAERLAMTRVELAPDVLLVLQRYHPGTPFGPPLPPTRVETDPPGAQVVRNLLRVGAAPVDVAGGSPNVDLLDVELPGWRKQHRALGSAEKLGLGLRSEDRLPVIVDAVSVRPLGSDAQAAVLSQLARMGTISPSGRVVVFGPAQQGGQAVAGEGLAARLYDLRARRWVGRVVMINAGPPSQQAQTLAALAAGNLPAAAGGQAVAKTTKPNNPSAFDNLRLPFARTKWYSWVIAGGVAALIVGLLVADRFGSDSLTVHATH